MQAAGTTIQDGAGVPHVLQVRRTHETEPTHYRDDNDRVVLPYHQCPMYLSIDQLVKGYGFRYCLNCTYNDSIEDNRLSMVQTTLYQERDSGWRPKILLWTSGEMRALADETLVQSRDVDTHFLEHYQHRI